MIGWAPENKALDTEYASVTTAVDRMDFKKKNDLNKYLRQTGAGALLFVEVLSSANEVLVSFQKTASDLHSMVNAHDEISFWADGYQTIRVVPMDGDEDDEGHDLPIGQYIIALGIHSDIVGAKQGTHVGKLDQLQAALSDFEALKIPLHAADRPVHREVEPVKKLLNSVLKELKFLDQSNQRIAYFWIKTPSNPFELQTLLDVLGQFSLGYFTDRNIGLIPGRGL